MRVTCNPLIQQAAANKEAAGTLGAVQVPALRYAPNEIMLCLFGWLNSMQNGRCTGIEQLLRGAFLRSLWIHYKKTNLLLFFSFALDVCKVKMQFPNPPYLGYLKVRIFSPATKQTVALCIGLGYSDFIKL